MAATATRATPASDEATLLWRVALTIFVITIGIGLVNGQRIGQIDPQVERPLLLTHLHTGAIGWVSLSLFGAVIWLFASGRDGVTAPRMLARFAMAAVGLYPIVFFLFYPGGLLSNAALLGLFGVLALIAIVWMLAWTIGQSRQVYMSVARLAGLTAVFNLALGAILGVLVEARFAGLDFPGNVNQAHPAMMTIGYILPAAFMFVEWRLGAGVDGRRSLAGTISIGLLAVGGWLAVIASTANMPQLFPPILLLQVAATVILAVRMARRVVGVDWLSGAERYVAITTIAIVIDVGLLFYAVTAYFAQGATPPRELFIGISHTEFVGVMTNAIFATLLVATAAQRDAVRPWTDNWIFWGVNIGWVGFALVELIGAAYLAALFTPIMGIALLLGVGTFYLRLRASAATA